MAKTLYRSDSGKMLFGVCRGVADYLDVDVSIVRIIWGVLAFTFIGLLAYVIAATVLPKQP